ncbi:ankyrin repeat domain-containing protein 65-like [Latimeria chalumnae]|uniref:ankyrin repeat domain-containing protein 65-like n=1 Tax=Latimeria chalumnae TaxID=7897 RepID=UPI00313DDB6F
MSQDENGWTLLHHAAFNGHTTLTKLLVQRGAPVNATDKHGYTPLHRAAWSGHTQMAEFLLQRGALPTAAASQGLTPLHVAAANGHLLTAQLLLQRGVEPNVLDRNNWTPLHWAAVSQQLHLIDLLVSEGAATEPGTGDGPVAPLHLAVELGKTDSFHLLLEKGAQPNAKDELGRTALLIASANASEEVQYVFLEADVGHCDYNQEPEVRVAW